MSDGSQRISNTSPWSVTSSAPASRTAARTSSSVGASACGTARTPLRWKLYATLPGSAMVPPLRLMAVRTSAAARFLLSVRHSTSIATPLAA
jgi:hypothetical protein